MPSKPRARRGRKLLVASVGVATLSFVGVECSNTSVANLPAPPSCLERPNDPFCLGSRPDAGVDADGTPDAPADGK
jgi:hypothetical protein